MTVFVKNRRGYTYHKALNYTFSKTVLIQYFLRYCTDVTGHWQSNNPCHEIWNLPGLYLRSCHALRSHIPKYSLSSFPPTRRSYVWSSTNKIIMIYPLSDTWIMRESRNFRYPMSHELDEPSAPDAINAGVYQSTTAADFNTYKLNGWLYEMAVHCLQLWPFSRLCIAIGHNRTEELLTVQFANQVVLIWALLLPSLLYDSSSMVLPL